MNEKILNRNVVLPTEIELNEIEKGKGNAFDLWKEDNFFDFDFNEAQSEREHVDGIIKELSSKGMWNKRYVR